MENPVNDSGLTPDYEVAIDGNAAYYLPRFAEFDKGASRLGWNWPALFVTAPWFLYRKMWVPGILTLFYPFMLCIFAGIAAAALAEPMKAHPAPFTAVFLVLLVAPWLLMPMFANAIYWRHIRELIDKIPLLEQAPDKRAVHLARHGGTSVGVMIGALSFALVPTLGVLAAIAIPAYQDYTIRAQITEGLNLAATPKTAVTEYYAQNGDWPEDSAAVGLAAISGNYVESVDVQKGSVVIIYGGASNTNIADKTLIMLPGLDESGNVLWTCANAEVAGIVEYAQGPYGTNVPQKYLPARCRGEPATAN